MDRLLFKVGEIPSGGVSIEIPGRGIFSGWRKDANRLEIHAVIDGTGWQDGLLSVIQELELSFPQGFEGAISLTRADDTLIVRGHLMTVVRRACSRCTELFDKDLDVPFRSVFTHDGVAAKDVELTREDLDFNFFRGDQFDVGQVITEQISLGLPVKPLCHDDCLGLCVRCGKNLNDGICACKDEAVDIRFEKLKALHLK
jgi:uncharacterized protein